MCGIAGVFGRNEPAVVAEMLATLIHRGPDDRHQVGEGEFTFGACRLSIQDLAHGRQPMESTDRKICAMQNGEIYNYPELRQQLEGKGWKFQSHCDTEILAALYKNQGRDFFVDLEGMFAVALWDAERKEGVLVRDRMGKKPLYYASHGGALYFASEIKALLSVPGMSRELDAVSLKAYLGLKHVPGPRSIFSRIRQVPPGHVLVWKAGNQFTCRPYWELSEKEVEPADPAEVVPRFLELLRTGIQQRLLSDVPVGFFLSGGLDSSLVTALAAEGSSRPVRTFTLTLDSEHVTPGKEADQKWAGWVAQRFGTTHQEERVEVRDLGEQLKDVLRAFDEPFAGVISPYFLSRVMVQHVKVAMCGDGADELLGSYLSHRLAASLEQGEWAYPRSPEEEKLFAGIRSDDPAVWRSKLEVFQGSEISELLSPDWRKPSGDDLSAEARWREALQPFAGRTPLPRMLSAEFTTLLPDQILKYADRLSMAHSLEVRSPYLSRELVEFVSALPACWKIRGKQTKFLMKEAARRYFPEEMVSRPKEGFFLPLAQWLRTSLRPLVEEHLRPETLRRQGLLDPAAVGTLRGIWEKGDPSDYRLANKIYSLLILSLWHDQYVR
jgi:asparagine synthase (glutamine-hydrolysing)